LPFKPQNLPTGLLYASLHFQTCGILTSETANLSDFSPHIIFAVSWHRICGLTVAMIDKTLICDKKSLPSLIMSKTN